MMLPNTPWTYPAERYYYGWLGEPIATEPTDGDIKARIVAQLRKNPHTADADIKVDVKQRVVILGGVVATPLAKRVAGDDAWDTEGVVDVSNQLQIGEIAR
jgi:osmotically-inducible protein OsmY